MSGIAKVDMVLACIVLFLSLSYVIIQWVTYLREILSRKVRANPIHDFHDTPSNESYQRYQEHGKEYPSECNMVLQKSEDKTKENKKGYNYSSNKSRRYSRFICHADVLLLKICRRVYTLFGGSQPKGNDTKILVVGQFENGEEPISQQIEV
jgi:hypothetical protein